MKYCNPYFYEKSKIVKIVLKILTKSLNNY